MTFEHDGHVVLPVARNGRADATARHVGVARKCVRVDAQNAAKPTDFFSIPANRVVELGTQDRDLTLAGEGLRASTHRGATQSPRECVGFLFCRKADITMVMDMHVRSCAYRKRAAKRRYSYAPVSRAYSHAYFCLSFANAAAIAPPASGSRARCCDAPRPLPAGRPAAPRGCCAPPPLRDSRRAEIVVEAHGQRDALALHVDFQHLHLDDLPGLHDLVRVLDELRRHRRHVHEPVLMHADVDERAECRDVGHDAFEHHAGLQVARSPRRLRGTSPS